MTFTEMEKHGHDVYEFCYRYDADFPKHWNEDSLYINSDEMNILGPYIDKVISMFHYYGPQRVEISDWERIKNLCLKENPNEAEFLEE